MHALTVLSLLEQMELSIGHLYRRYANGLSTDRDASSFFYRVALEEGQHATLIRYQRKVAWQNPKQFDPPAMDLKEIVRVTRHARELAAEERTPTVEEAIAMASEFEIGIAEVHYRLAVRPAEHSLTRLLSHLGSADSNHKDQIADFAFRRGLCLYMKGARTHSVVASA